MEVLGINGTIGIRFPRALPNAERISARIIENRDRDGDQRLNVQELGNRAELLSRVDANDDNLIDQQELFTALNKRLEERHNASIEISFDINVIKANLGSLLAHVLTDSGSLAGLLGGNGVLAEDTRLDANLRERYISSLITSGIDDGGLFSASGTPTAVTGTGGSLFPFATAPDDGRQLLLNLLIEELGTPREDALAIIDALQSQPLHIIA